jgi:hypothetical protein
MGFGKMFDACQLFAHNVLLHSDYGTMFGTLLRQMLGFTKSDGTLYHPI